MRLVGWDLGSMIARPFGADVSKDTSSKITDTVLAERAEWGPVAHLASLPPQE